MPRISMYKPTRSDDFRFLDGVAGETFVVGGTDVHIHKYLGPAANPEGDASQPVYATQSEKNIQDLLFLENRDRVYEKDIYTLRGVYNVSDIDFDLSQFGMFLTSDTIFVSFHIKTMVDKIGRKLMAGDVIELPHLKDFYNLDASNMSAALKRFYVVQDANNSAEGFSATWYPHIWRIKATPLVDSREFAGVIKNIATDDEGNVDTGLVDMISNYDQHIAINTAVVAAAEAESPLSGYDTEPLFTIPTNEDGSPAAPTASPQRSGYDGHLLGTASAPNSMPVTPAVAFPDDPAVGDYVLRLDYMPNRLFRYSGNKWVFIQDNVRTPMFGADDTGSQKGTFVNNTNTFVKPDKTEISEKQGLSQVLDSLKPGADN